MSRAGCVRPSGWLLFQTSIDGDAAAPGPVARGPAGQAYDELDAEQLAEMRRSHPTSCDRCGNPFLADRHLLTLTGHYVKGSDWELCLVCTGDFLRWLGQRDNDGRPLPPGRAEPRTKHQ